LSVSTTFGFSLASPVTAEILRPKSERLTPLPPPKTSVLCQICSLRSICCIGFLLTCTIRRRVPVFFFFFTAWRVRGFLSAWVFPILVLTSLSYPEGIESGSKTSHHVFFVEMLYPSRPSLTPEKATFPSSRNGLLDSQGRRMISSRPHIKGLPLYKLRK